MPQGNLSSAIRHDIKAAFFVRLGAVGGRGDDLVMQRRRLAGSLIGGIRETQEMLDFCAEHGVTPEIEVIEASYVNEAYERVLASDVRYRFVIDTSTI